METSYNTTLGMSCDYLGFLRKVQDIIFVLELCLESKIFV